MNPLPPQECPNCGESMQPTATFCARCGRRSRPVATEPAHTKAILILVAVCVGIGLVYFLNSHHSSPGVISSFVSSGVAQSAAALTNDKVERAVSSLTGNLRVAGAINVEGIQELPQDSSAKADLRFTNFQYKADMAGTPVSSDRQPPEEPKVNDPNFYDKMYRFGTQQVHMKTYSGPGMAVLKHYNDGRWVLKEVRWEFNGWAGNVDVR